MSTVTGPASTARRAGPSAPARLRRALHIVERNFQVYRRGWIYFVSGFLEPFFYLLSIGVGLSHLVGDVRVGGQVVSYTLFVAPGLLASSAMNGAIFDTTYNLFFKLKVAHTYDAVLATPLGTADVALGEIGWALARGMTYAVAFLGVMAALGLVGSPWAILCLPGAALVSLAFAATGMAATSYMTSWQDLDGVFLAMLPMFLFSGTFYPLTVYPGAIAELVRITPLYQGVALLRALDTGTVSWSLLWHVAYLAALGGVGAVVTARRLRRLLAP